MKTAAIISTATIAGSIAFAAGRGDKPAELTTSPNESKRTRAMGGDPQPPNDVRFVGGPSGNCAPSSEPWFSPIAREFAYDCRIVGSQDVRCADVNRDGVEDYFVTEAPIMALVVEGQPVPTQEQLLVNSRLIGRGATPFHTHFVVFPSSTIPGATLKELFPNLRQASIASLGLGWRDCDGDGDLDLVMWLSLVQYGANDNEVRPFWFENIGYEKPAPPVAADLNHDGKVDGADLGLLLVAWGPNP